MLQQVKELSLAESAAEYQSNFSRIVTQDPEMEKLFQSLRKVGSTRSTILILGESGTGKELVAQAIHELSNCRGHFVPVNCGAIPDTLLESELFGYEKGAFTGAVGSKPGRFFLADSGTIFLDEIGEMSPHLQVKLLRVLQDKTFEPVGGIKSITVNTRVIAATNVNLRERVAAGLFREDLYYRLQVVPIELPALRARRGDIELLTNHFSQHFARLQNRKPLLFSSEVIDAFRRYNWPGNIRELENLIERLSIMTDGNAVYTADVPAHILDGGSCSSSYFLEPKLPEDGINFNEVVEQFENTLIVQALQRCSGNKKAAARLLNLNRTTLVEKIKKKGLAEADDKDVAGFTVSL